MLTKFYVFFLEVIYSEKTKKFFGFFAKIFKSKIVLAIVLLILLLEMQFFITKHKLSINISESLPFRVFFVDMRQSSIDKIKDGDYIQFRNNNTQYYSGKNITKMVLAVGGDRLEIKQYKNPSENIQATIIFDNITLEVKDRTVKGTKIYTNDIKTIPQDQYFVYGTHIDSFDSRYKEFGLINKQEVIGVAKPLF